MKKIFLTVLFLVCFGFVFSNKVFAEQKVGMVDVQKVIENSAQVQALNEEQKAKITELEKWVETVKKDVEKQQTQEGKEKLFNQYRTTYERKKFEIIKDGQTKMQAIMNDISNTIQSQAKEKGYDMIISKSVVIYGSEDITEDVLKAVNSKTPASTKKLKTLIKK